MSSGWRWREQGVLASNAVALAGLHAVMCGIEVAVDADVAALDVFSDSQDALRLLTGLGGRLLADAQTAACLA